jgi:hypothetical protein
MRLQIEPSEIMVERDGKKVRVWNGVSENGTQCFVFVAAVAVREGWEAEFERELEDYDAPLVIPVEIHRKERP